jgi:Response regulators consisting of a CheY-like receiver domain and a winged-helix DNA-binding domain
MPMQKPSTILIAEDDDDDFLLTEQALGEAHLRNPLKRAADGQELMDYLERRGVYRDRKVFPDPALILLDLNMPRKDGREALREIKASPQLRHIPVVVLTTSKAEEDIVRSYELGVNSFIIKPVTFGGFVEAVKVLGRYWFELVKLPHIEAPNEHEQVAHTRS